LTLLSRHALDGFHQRGGQHQHEFDMTGGFPRHRFEDTERRKEQQDCSHFRYCYGMLLNLPEHGSTFKNEVSR
jgi:hypothetical protein